MVKDWEMDVDADVLLDMELIDDEGEDYIQLVRDATGRTTLHIQNLFDNPEDY